MANILYDALFAPLIGRQSRLIILPDGREMSGDAFGTLVQRLAAVLVREGLQPGDRLAVQVAKSPEALALYGAALATGAVFLPLNTAYTAAELRYFVENAGARLLVGDPGKSEALAVVAEAAGAKLLSLGSHGEGSLADLAEAEAPGFQPQDRGPDDLAALLYTSGTTGRAKGAMLTHRNLLSNAEVLAEAWRFTAKDVLLHALPIFHTHGLFVACNISLLTGGAMIFLPGFSPEEVFRHLPAATSMMGVPTFYSRLLGDARLTRAAVAHIRLFVSGSAPLLEATHIQFAERTGQAILERYGMTETNMNSSNPYDGVRRAGTVGMALPGVEVRIADAAGLPLPAGETGMIEVRGPNVFAGYWQLPDKTAEELRANGFFITGDLGRFDDQGYLQIVGRQKDLIISGGYNIYPKEIELLLDAAPSVLESAVIGLPHPDLGEAVVAVLVAEPGGSIDQADLMAGLAVELARFKLPKALIVLPELPRNAMGKVQKAALRRDYAGWFLAP